jgi:hypothetical protein
MAEAVRLPPGYPPPGVAERLERLRTLYVSESAADVRQRLASSTRAHEVPFATAAARRLEELRALFDLANHVHRQGYRQR